MLPGTLQNSITGMGKPQREESPDVVKSKVLSYILRHGAEKEMLHVRSDGYIKVADLLDRPKCKDIDLPELLRLVKENAKQRFVLFYGFDPTPPPPKGKKPQKGASQELPLVKVDITANESQPSDPSGSQRGEYFIRAAQGHTIALAESSDHLTPVTAADEPGLAAVGEMVHGTTVSVWDQIRRTGLSRMERQHIHLAPARANHQITPRASSNIFIHLSLQSLLSANPPIPVYTAANGVILSPGDRTGHISPEHFSKVVHVSGKRDVIIWSEGKPTEAGQQLIQRENDRLKRMPHSLHSHSGQFCRHAKDNLEDVVKEAIRKGFRTFGLSEHAPRYRVEDLYPEEDDLTPEDLLATYYSFISEAKRLKQHYADEIELFIGIETDHITAMDSTGLSKVLKVKNADIDYMVGSVHHVNGVPIDFDRPTWVRAVKEAASEDAGRTMVPPKDPSGKPTMVPSLSDVPSDYIPSSEELLPYFNAYFDAQYQLLSAHKPEVIGHFDLCRLFIPDVDFKGEGLSGVWVKIQRNIRFAAGYGALFELNAAAFRKGWVTSYPGNDIVELILACRGRLCLSDDSHGVQAVGLNYSRLRSYVAELGLKELWCLAKDPGGPKGKGRPKRKTIPVLVAGKLDGDDSWPKD